MKPLTFSCRSTFKRLFLHKNKDKKSSLEGVEETENTAPGLTVLETATTKKNLEGWSLAASEMEGRAARVPGDVYGAQGFRAGPGYRPPTPGCFLTADPSLQQGRVLVLCVWDPASPGPHLTSCSFSLQPPATSTATQQARSTPRSQEAKGRRTETSRSAKSQCRRSGENQCSARSPMPTSSST